MLNLNAEKLEQTTQEAFNLAQGAKDSKRWQTAITKAWAILRDCPFWHFTEDGAFLILSPDSDQIYEVTDGACELIAGERRVPCKAFSLGQPCKHRAARRLLVRYTQS